MDKTTILVIENNKIILLCIETILKEKGFDVISTQCSIEALSIINSTNIKLIICNMITPELSGQELFNILKENSKYSNIPFIMTTGSINEQKRAQPKTEGILAIIPRNNLIKELIAELQNFEKLNK
ncbi:MAG: hypothetical protein A2X12_02095 [Bacteroidetes bacterium GWE2_29_8]|nr:MAG: hypothetical protein A2X12_02095 [Bacteroidetes bacterium GWE2_29_8]